MRFGQQAAARYSTVVPASALTFPLVVSSSGRYLKTASGTPFPLRGDAAYSLIAQLSGSSLTQYLDAMQAAGVNALIVNLYEKYFSSSAPNNALGVAPFSTANDIRTASTTYFAHALTVIRAAAARGMVVLLETAYSGFAAGAEGWWTSAINTRTAGECTTFGQLIGAQLVSEKNIIWVQSGDYTPASQTKINALMSGILSQSPASTLCTYHTDPYSNSRAVSGVTNLQLDWVYTFDGGGAPSGALVSAYSGSPTMPAFHGEPRYEGNGGAFTVQWIQEQIYGSFLAGMAGCIPGNEARWHFDAPTGFVTTGWVNSLTSSLTVTYQYIKTFTDSVRWYEFAPDTGSGLISSARGTLGADGYVTAGRTADNLQACVYRASSSSINIVRAAMSGTFSAQWFNPNSGAFTNQSGTPFANSGADITMTPPAAGCVLILKA